MAQVPSPQSSVPYSTFTPAQREMLTRINRDESKVGPLHLPSSLTMENGDVVDSPEKWRDHRRPELLRLFENHVYGRMLPSLPFSAEIVEKSTEACGGRATRIQVQLSFSEIVFHLILYLPNGTDRPAPCFLGLNFRGNHSAFSDPEIPLSTAWMTPGQEGIENHRSTEATRGTSLSRWPVEMIIDRGYALATLYYGDIEPDYDGGEQEGIRSLFNPPGSERKGDDAGAITTWAWGLSRVMDYLETLPGIDPHRVCLTGHSRLGKTALWASACDPRFALVVSNNSGCGGASLSRRDCGETLHILSYARPYWFCKNCLKESPDIASMPIDQHMLIALSAPRPVFISSAEKDTGADPRGEFLSARHASDVFRLLGKEGITAEEIPPMNSPLLSTLGYYIRPGGHDITVADWKVHLDFADRQLSKP